MARSQPIRRERRGLPLRAHDPARTPLRPRFAEYLAAKRKISARTRDDYQRPFDLYCRWLSRGGLAETLGSFTVEHLAAYADYLRERPAEPGRRPFDRDRLSVHSQHAYLRPLNQFGDYLAWAGWLEVNPFSETYESIMPTISATTRIIKLATAADIEALLRATIGDDPLALRDHALLLSGWESGMRAQDVYGLDLDDLDLRTGLLTIRHSKGDRDRQVKLGTLALPAIAAYLGMGRPRQVSTAVRRRPDFAGTALFLSDKAGEARSPDGRLTSGGIYQLLTRRWNVAGREGTFGAHRLRHGIATLLVEANISLAQVSSWLGQSLETTTMLYAHPSAEAIHRHVGPVVDASLRDAGYTGLDVA